MIRLKINSFPYGPRPHQLVAAELMYKKNQKSNSDAALNLGDAGNADDWKRRNLFLRRKTKTITVSAKVYYQSKDLAKGNEARKSFMMV